MVQSCGMARRISLQIAKISNIKVTRHCRPNPNAAVKAWSARVFPIHSLVAQSGLEFPIDEMVDFRTAPPSGFRGP